MQIRTTFGVEWTDSDICPPHGYNSVEGIQDAASVEGRGSSGAVSVDKCTEVSTDTAPEVRSLVTPLCQKDLQSSKTFVLRSVLKKPAVKLCVESLQVSRELHLLKQIKSRLLLVPRSTSEILCHTGLIENVSPYFLPPLSRL